MPLFRGLLDVLSLWPTYSSSRQAALCIGELFRRPILDNCSDYFRLERHLPGRIRAHWKTVPLHCARHIGVC